MGQENIKEWSAEEVEKLTELFRDYQSAAVIGRVLRRTRNSVIGKINRLKLKREDRRPTVNTVRKSKKRPTPALGPIARVFGPHMSANAFGTPSRVRHSWQSEEIDTLKRMWASGYSCSVIAHVLERTEEGVKLQRKILKLPERETVYRLPPAKRGKEWEPIEGSLCIDLEKLGSNSCKWPLGEEEFTFCGLPTLPNPRGGQLPYCEVHHKMSMPKQRETKDGKTTTSTSS